MRLIISSKIKITYYIYYQGGSTKVSVNQYSSSWWTWKEVKLGTWNFPSGANTYVKVTDATGETYDGYTTLNVDTIKFVKKASSSITVTSPNGGEHWPKGRNREIKWTSSGVSGNVRIDLSRNGGSSWETLFSSTANDGSEWWAVTGTETTQARIRVVSLQNTAVSDMSNANFKIFSITATVTSPTSGTNWPAGSSQTITWSMGGDTSDLNYFWVYYSVDGGLNWQSINTAAGSARSLSWSIPSGISSSQCKIRVRALDVDAYILTEGVSDTFSIGPSTQTGSITVITNLDLSTFTIIGPETYHGSGKSWSTSDVPAGTYTINYGEVSGYITPSSETKTLVSGGAITFTGTYISSNNGDLCVMAANLAMQVVGKGYHQGDTLSKGWNNGRFLDPSEIQYLDCSGLVYWAYNRGWEMITGQRIPHYSTWYEENNCVDEAPHPVFYLGASGQWNDGERFEQISTTIPTVSDLKIGDLLFLDTNLNELADHVGMYVGNGDVIHSKGGVGVERKTLSEWLDLPLPGDKKYRDYFVGYGRVKTSMEPPDDVYWLAKVIMSEASIGTQEERIAVGWTVLNRFDSGRFGSSIEIVVKNGYAYNQEPNQEIILLAKDLIGRKIPDLTGGATHFFSPRSMTSGYGPYKIPGTNEISYIPSWAIPKGYSKESPPPLSWEMTEFYQTIDYPTTEWVGGLENVRNYYFMFYRPIGKPLTAYACGPYYGNINEPVQFHGSATGGTPPYTYAWDFNKDGLTDSALQNPTHSWSVAGTYYPTLKVVDDKGIWSDPDVCTVLIKTPPRYGGDLTGVHSYPHYSIGDNVDIGVDIKNTGDTPETYELHLVVKDKYDTPVSTDTIGSIYLTAGAKASEKFSISPLSVGHFSFDVNLKSSSSGKVYDDANGIFSVLDYNAIQVVEDDADSLMKAAHDELDEMVSIVSDTTYDTYQSLTLDVLKDALFDTIIGKIFTPSQLKLPGMDVNPEDIAKASENLVNAGNELMRVLETDDSNLRNRLKDEFMVYVVPEKLEVEQRDKDFEEFIRDTPFTRNDRIIQLFNIGKENVRSTSESAWFTITKDINGFLPGGEISFHITLREERDLYESIKKAFAWVSMGIAIVVLIAAVLFALGTVGFGLIAEIPFLITVLKAFFVKKVAFAAIVVLMLFTLPMIAPQVPLRHDTTLDAIESIITHQSTSTANVLSIASEPQTSFDKDMKLSITVDKKLSRTSEPIIGIVVSPDGRIIDMSLYQTNPYASEFETLASSVRLPHQPGKYKILAMSTEDMMKSSVKQVETTQTSPNISVSISTDKQFGCITRFL